MALPFEEELRNVETTGARLREINRSINTDRRGARKVRDLIARHPNAPWGLLVALLPEQAEGVAANPALKFFKLAEPQWPFPMTYGCLLGLAKHVDAVAEQMGWPDVRDADARLTELHVILLCLQNVKLSTWMQNRKVNGMASMHLYHQSWFREIDLSPFVWRHMLNFVSTHERRIFAERRSEQWLLEHLVNAYGLERQVAGNANAPGHLLDALSESRHVELRCIVARNPNLPRGVLSRLARDEDVRVRKAVLERKYLDDALVHQLRCDADYGVRQAAVAKE
ncbi:MAG: hypothetical protein ACE366_11385 [Bradymonadia bacterium]